MLAIGQDRRHHHMAFRVGAHVVTKDGFFAKIVGLSGGEAGEPVLLVLDIAGIERREVSATLVIPTNCRSLPLSAQSPKQHLPQAACEQKPRKFCQGQVCNRNNSFDFDSTHDAMSESIRNFNNSFDFRHDAMSESIRKDSVQASKLVIPGRLSSQRLQEISHSGISCHISPRRLFSPRSNHGAQVEKLSKQLVEHQHYVTTLESKVDSFNSALAGAMRNSQALQQAVDESTKEIERLRQRLASSEKRCREQMQNAQAVREHVLGKVDYFLKTVVEAQTEVSLFQTTFEQEAARTCSRTLTLHKKLEEVDTALAQALRQAAHWEREAGTNSKTNLELKETLKDRGEALQSASAAIAEHRNDSQQQRKELADMHERLQRAETALADHLKQSRLQAEELRCVKLKLDAAETQLECAEQAAAAFRRQRQLHEDALKQAWVREAQQKHTEITRQAKELGELKSKLEDVTGKLASAEARVREQQIRETAMMTQIREKQRELDKINIMLLSTC